MQKTEIKNILEKQLELLSEKSQSTQDVEMLCSLSKEIAELAEKLLFFI